MEIKSIFLFYGYRFYYSAFSAKYECRLLYLINQWIYFGLNQILNKLDEESFNPNVCNISFSKEHILRLTQSQPNSEKEVCYFT